MSATRACASTSPTSPKVWRALEVVPHDFRDLGDRVLVFGRVFARGEGGYISDSPDPVDVGGRRRAGRVGASVHEPRGGARRRGSGRIGIGGAPEYDGRP